MSRPRRWCSDVRSSSTTCASSSASARPIESLCRRIGIRTWWDLATTEPSLLRTLLTEARPGLATDDSASWPLQARLLAEGRWAEFKALTDELASARPSD